MVELYWQALARDVPFTDYSTSPVTQAAMADLNRSSAFHGPTVGGQVTPATLFRGNVTGGLTGPFHLPVLLAAGSGQLDGGPATLSRWSSRDRLSELHGMNGLCCKPACRRFAPGRPTRNRKYIYNGRSLAEWVHYDFLYQTYHNAALILLNQSPDTILNTNPYLNPDQPLQEHKGGNRLRHVRRAGHLLPARHGVQGGAAGGLVPEVAGAPPARPEEFGGRVHQTKIGAANYPIHADLLNSAALKAVFAANGNYLLPQAYPEGCPLHPSYPQGHGTVAGACSVMLKAFFDETQILTDCVVASADGTTLTPYDDTALTVGGEINKLAFNVAMGRDFAGIHYRSDAEAGFRLGEDVAIAMLQDLVQTFAEDFAGFQFTRLDGTPVSITKGNT